MQYLMMKCKQAINLKDKIINKQNAEFRVKHFLIFDLDFPYSLLVSVVLELLPLPAFIIYVKALTHLAFTA